MMDLKQHKKTVYSTVFLLLFSLLFSCTVTKRHFGSGYHVEWKRNYAKEKMAETKPSETALDKAEAEHVECLNEQLVVNQEVKAPENKITEERVVFQEEPIKEPMFVDSENKENLESIASNQSEVLSSEETPLDDDEEIESPRKTESFTWAALAMFITSLIFGIWVGALFSSAFTLVLGMTFLGFAGVLFGLVLIFFVFSLISFIRIKRNPGMYKNKALTKVLLGISMVALTAAGIILSIALAFDSSKPMMQGW